MANGNCQKCGAPLRDGCKFCVECGEPIAAVPSSSDKAPLSDNTDTPAASPSAPQSSSFGYSLDDSMFDGPIFTPPADALDGFEPFAPGRRTAAGADMPAEAPDDAAFVLEAPEEAAASADSSLWENSEDSAAPTSPVTDTRETESSDETAAEAPADDMEESVQISETSDEKPFDGGADVPDTGVESEAEPANSPASDPDNDLYVTDTPAGEPDDVIARDDPADDIPDIPSDTLGPVPAQDETHYERAVDPEVSEDGEEFSDAPSEWVKPPAGSPFSPLSGGGYFLSLLLMAVPIVGWVFTLIWAFGGTHNHNRRNLARAVLMLALIGILLLLICFAVGKFVLVPVIRTAGGPQNAVMEFIYRFSLDPLGFLKSLITLF